MISPGIQEELGDCIILVALQAHACLESNLLSQLVSEILAGLVILAFASVLIAWRRETIGGTLALLAGVGLGSFAYITAGRNKVGIMLFTGAPFAIAGMLFLLCGRKAMLVRD